MGNKAKQKQGKAQTRQGGVIGSLAAHPLQPPVIVLLGSAVRYPNRQQKRRKKKEREGRREEKNKAS